MQTQSAFDMVIAIARGGMPPARFICDFLNIDILSSIQIRHYKSGGRQTREAEVIDNIGRSVRDKHVLVIDDVNDSGYTLQAASRYLRSLKPAILKTGVLHEKENTTFSADFKGEILKEWEWLIYQWAAAEDILEFLNNAGLNNADIKTAKKFLSQSYDLYVEESLMEIIFNVKENHSDQ